MTRRPLAGLGLAALLAATGCLAEIGDALPTPGEDRTARADAAPAPDYPDAAPPPDAMIVPDAAPPAPACIEGDARVTDPGTGNCYMYFATEASWADASAACEALPGDTHLVTVTSLAENELIAPLGGSVADVWMGASDQAVEGTWVWITAEAMSFEGWRINEPNDGNSVDRAEDCMIMEVDNGGTWDDRDCPNLYGYYCEREGSI